MSKELLYDKLGQGLSISQWKNKAENAELRASKLAAKSEDYRIKLISQEREIERLRTDLKTAEKKIRKLEDAFEAADMDEEYGEGTAWSEAQDGYRAAEDEISRLSEIIDVIISWINRTQRGFAAAEIKEIIDSKI